MAWIVAVFPLATTSAQPQTSGQLSAWCNHSSDLIQLGARYIPDLSMRWDTNSEWSLDSRLSVNAYGAAQGPTPAKMRSRGSLDAYRLWLRAASKQFEARLGLQKINFGSAAFLRPLMWFDRIDPRDPLQLTDGVYGLLFRYYFLNNANLWLWGLYGNNRSKGWEQQATVENTVEYGGRAQYPVLTGELAFSYHRRRAPFEPDQSTDLVPSDDIPENRFAIDGKWDIGVGVWFENSFITRETSADGLPYTNQFAIGMDWTCPVGNGLYLLAEHLSIDISQEGSGRTRSAGFTAVSANYPLGVIDRVAMIVYYNWDEGDLYRFVTWQRQYDSWGLHLFLYWNPEQLFINPASTYTMAGKGIQVMFVTFH